VVEADESDGTFLDLPAELVVVTNVEADHLDHFGDLAGVVAAFDRFVDQATGPRIVCADEPNALALARRHGATTYGTSDEADWRIVDAVTGRVGVQFRLVEGGNDRGEVRLPIPGLHNARNATAALVAAVAMGAPFDTARDALARYAGVARRFEFRGEVEGATFVDDYAHNPGKVAAVLAAAAGGGWGRVVAVFQPHRYSRTGDLAGAWGPAFVEADLVAVADVYGAGEAPIPGVTGKVVVDDVLAARPWKRVAWLPRRDDVIAYLAAELRPGDLCLTIGAGDVTAWSEDIQDALRANPSSNRRLDRAPGRADQPPKAG
jgi:UDP-N-acetylmuramate--alanine ligase